MCHPIVSLNLTVQLKAQRRIEPPAEVLAIRERPDCLGLVLRDEGGKQLAGPAAHDAGGGEAQQLPFGLTGLAATAVALAEGHAGDQLPPCF
ncbi:hypothetical protein D3C80_1726670 [compost metagenome]